MRTFCPYNPIKVSLKGTVEGNDGTNKATFSLVILALHCSMHTELKLSRVVQIHNSVLSLIFSEVVQENRVSTSTIAASAHFQCRLRCVRSRASSTVILASTISFLILRNGNRVYGASNECANHLGFQRPVHSLLQVPHRRTALLVMEPVAPTKHPHSIA